VGGGSMRRLLQADLLVLTSQRKREQSEAALDALCRNVRTQGRPLLFLDFDDVLCLNKPYCSHDVFQKEAERPIDLWERLWHPPAAQTLLSIVDEYRPYIVITTNWLRLLERDAFIALFKRTGLDVIADVLHDVWDAPQDRGSTRYEAIEKWLREHYDGQPLVVLDDERSGTGLLGSRLDKAGCVVLCKAGVGLHTGHLPAVRSALDGKRGRV